MKKTVSLKEILSPIQKDLQKVEDLVLANLETDIPLLTEVGQYILNSGGKRVRPALLLLSAGMIGEITEQTRHAANIIEYIHTATLLHDDVVDNAEIRRAKKSARSIWGNEASVLVGDYLFTVSFKYLSAFRNHAVVESLSNATTQMARGEILQLTRSNETATESDYLEIVFYKTASLMASAMEIGAVLSGCKKDRQKTLYECGTNIGIAFQLIDDALDYDLGNSKMGKSIGTDLKERKITLPLSHLLQNASKIHRNHVLDILEEDEITDRHVEEVCKLVDIYQSVRYTKNRAKSYMEIANKLLKGLPDNTYRESIHLLTEYIISRKR